MGNSSAQGPRLCCGVPAGTLPAGGPNSAGTGGAGGKFGAETEVEVVGTDDPDPCVRGSFMPPAAVARLLGDSVCAICFEPLVNQAQTIAICGHIFHRSCLNRCGSALCPQCRQPIEPGVGQALHCGSGSGGPAGASSLAVGMNVTLHGLQNNTEFNGRSGRIISIAEDGRLSEVFMPDGGQLFRVRPENLLVADVGGTASHGATGQDESATRQSARGAPAGVEGPASPPTSARGEPLDADVLQPGTVVQVVGLRNAAHALRYNGQWGEVLSIDRARGRYEVRLWDGGVKTIRAENIQRL